MAAVKEIYDLGSSGSIIIILLYIYIMCIQLVNYVNAMGIVFVFFVFQILSGISLRYSSEPRNGKATCWMARGPWGFISFKGLNRVDSFDFNGLRLNRAGLRINK